MSHRGGRPHSKEDVNKFTRMIRSWRIVTKMIKERRGRMQAHEGDTRRASDDVGRMPVDDGGGSNIRGDCGQQGG